MLLKANIITANAPSSWAETLRKMNVGDIWTLTYQDAEDQQGNNADNGRAAIFRLRKKATTAHLCFVTHINKKQNTFRIIRKKDRI